MMDYTKIKGNHPGKKGPMSLDPNNRNQRPVPLAGGRPKPVIKPVTGKPAKKD